MQASDIIERAETTLFDKENRFWSKPEFLSYIDEAQGRIADFKPDSASVTIDHNLKQGTRQALPEDGVLLLDVIRNLGFTELSPSSAITAVDRRVMDRAAPGWQRTTNKIVQHYMYDDRDRRVFYVYPGQPLVAGSVELQYVRRPPKLTSVDETLTLPDQYFGPVLDFLLYRAHAKDTASAMAAHAQAYFQQFQNALAMSNQAAQANTAGEREYGGLR